MPHGELTVTIRVANAKELQQKMETAMARIHGGTKEAINAVAKQVLADAEFEVQRNPGGRVPIDRGVLQGWGAAHD